MKKNGIRFSLDGKEWHWDGSFPAALDSLAEATQDRILEIPGESPAQPRNQDGWTDLVPGAIEWIEAMGGTILEVISPNEDGSLADVDLPGVKYY